MVDTVIVSDKWALDAEIWPEFQTTISPLKGGYEDRNQDFPLAFWHYRFRLVNRPLSEIKTYINLQLGRAGAARSFLLQDPIYNSLVNENIGTGDGTTTAFQAKQLYPDADNPYYRNWYEVRNLIVKKAGVTQTITTDYTVTNGLVTFLSAPASSAAITISGDPYVRVRFEGDVNPITLPIGPSVVTPYASTGIIHLREVPA